MQSSALAAFAEVTNPTGIAVSKIKTDKITAKIFLDAVVLREILLKSIISLPHFFNSL